MIVKQIARPQAAMLALSGILAASTDAQERYDLGGPIASIHNLAGRVEALAHDGPNVVVFATPQGARGEEIRGVNTSAQLSSDGRAALRFVYPDGDIAYRDASWKGTVYVRMRSDGEIVGSGRRGRDARRISSQGEGADAHMDLRVLVPSGGSVAIHLGVGLQEASGVDASLRLQSVSGRIVVRDARGDVRALTGSGALSIRGVQGDVSAKTGSGGMEIAQIQGAIEAETGSGAVEISDARGKSISISTGSGAVEGEGLASDEVEVETGSGGIRLSRVSSPKIECDTGSGSIQLDVLSDIEEIELSAGSGGVRLDLPGDLGATIDAATGSGTILADALQGRLSKNKRRYQGVIGDGGGSIEIKTGAGAIRIVAKS